MSKKYVAPEFASGRAPRRTGVTPAKRTRKLGAHKVPLPRPTRTEESR